MNRLTLIRAGLCLLVLLQGIDAHGSERVDERVRMALQLDPDVAQGAGVYRAHCSACHGSYAGGNPQKVIPALAGQREAYLIKQLADFTEREREAPQMHAVVVQAALNESQVWADVAAYLSQLRSTRSPQRGSASGARRGATLFQEQCVECHAADAGGDPDGFVPSLRGQHYSYLVLQLRELAASHRKNVDAELMQVLEGLQAREITALADYLSRMRGPVKDRATLRDDGALRN